MHHEDDLDDPNYDANRYDDATGWQPSDPYQKLREKALKEFHRTHIFGSMLHTLPANEWRMRREAKTGQPLFANIWKRGEMALLLGDKGACKSVLAVQIGADIARREKVLYIDCQRSGEQWEERYSSPVPYDTRRLRHRFPRNFMRSALDWDGTVPEACKGGVSEFLRYSIMMEIDGSQAKVVILDDLTAIRGGSVAGLASAVRMLKLWSVTENLSILALHSVSSPHVSKGTSGKPLEISPSALRICEAGDSVFAIGRSTFAEDIRYVKHLASPHPITHNEANVLTYRLERIRSPHSSPPYEGGVSDASSDGVVLSSPAQPSSLITRSEGPFLGLTSLGPSEERDHLRDYAAEALAAELAHQAELKKLRRRSSKDIFVDGVLDGSYAKYLNGK